MLTIMSPNPQTLKGTKSTQASPTSLQCGLKVLRALLNRGHGELRDACRGKHSHYKDPTGWRTAGT